MRTHRTSAVPLILGLFFFFAGGCSPTVPGGYEPPPQVDAGSSPTDLAAPPTARLLPLADEWWFWQPPSVPPGSFINLEVRAVWGPIARYPLAAPWTFKPRWDSKLQARCIPLRMSTDETYRCVPGWPQWDQPMLTSDGFFVDTELRDCWHYNDWRFPIPQQNFQKYLILFDERGGAQGYRVFEAIPEEGVVFFGWRQIPGPTYPICEASRSDWKYYRKGKEIRPDVFEELPDPTDPPK